ncbi:MAG: alpha/beta hydrolase [Actinomycetia bacterium]|nr:alpha/beta hydrolase [Actinomycetes bacterium]
MTEWITTSDGICIAYHQVGAGDPAIIFIHGAYSNRRGFGFQEEYFSPNHRCVAVDLRGHGESDKPDDVYTMDRHGDDVAELISHLGLNRPVLVGQSMAGQVIIAAAARHPDLVGAIASLDSPSNIPGWHQRHHGPYQHLMTPDKPFRETLVAFLSSSYLPTDDPSRLSGMAERLSEVPDHEGRLRPLPHPAPSQVPLPLHRLRPARSRLRSAPGTVPPGGDRQDGRRRTQSPPGRAGPDQRHAQPLHPTRRRHRGGDDPHRRRLQEQHPQDLITASPNAALSCQKGGWFSC